MDFLLGCCKESKTRDGAGHGTRAFVFDEEVKKVLQGDVKMFSGCKDEQTSADVEDVGSFNNPSVSESEKAGGACTNAMMSIINQGQTDISYGHLLVEMQKLLKKRKYTQVPQLSSSRQVQLTEEKFSLWNPNRSGRTRALLIGINYPGTEAELNGCVNDVRMMKRWLHQNGWSDAPDDMAILVDDPTEPGSQMPTCENIISRCKWLVEGAAAGDSLFIHYSGHGSQLENTDGTEEDGFDETLVPCDYSTAGQIRDDTLFSLLVAPLEKGVQLLAIFDCCHSGTMLDLPYDFVCDEKASQGILEGKILALGQNFGMDLSKVAHKVEDVKNHLFKGGATVGKLVLGKAKSFKSRYLKLQ